jgi:hypothetical protein
MSDWSELKKIYNINDAKFWCIMGQIHRMQNILEQPMLKRQTNKPGNNDYIICEIAKVCYGMKVIDDQDIANLIESYEL